jgi:hypothetical protein
VTTKCVEVPANLPAFGAPAIEVIATVAYCDAAQQVMRAETPQEMVQH